jgi:hypothetical protein
MNSQPQTGHRRLTTALAKAVGLLAALAVAVLVPLGASAQSPSRGALPRLTQLSHDRCATHSPTTRARSSR